jgi:hypothetical protein
MSKASSKNFADASGSSTIIAMCRSLLVIFHSFLDNAAELISGSDEAGSAAWSWSVLPEFRRGAIKPPRAQHSFVRDARVSKLLRCYGQHDYTNLQLRQLEGLRTARLIAAS